MESRHSQSREAAVINLRPRNLVIAHSAERAAGSEVVAEAVAEVAAEVEARVEAVASSEVLK